MKILYRYFMRDGDVAYAQVPVRYDDDNNMFAFTDEESSDVLFWGCPVMQDSPRANAYIECTRYKLILSDKEFNDLLEIGGIVRAGDEQ